MAYRPIFFADDKFPFVKEELIEFEWHKGLAVSQKQKSIRGLHFATKSMNDSLRVLEVSTKSEDNLGVQLSAFNLKIRLKNGHAVPLENVFHSSKVFQHGGPFRSLLALPAGEAKRDERLTTSGELIGFTSNGFDWPLTPKTIFYDWLYIKTVMTYPKLLRQLELYNAFSDIEFNPKKSINCQARSAALLVSLHKQGLLDKYTVDAKSFLINLSKPNGPNGPSQTDMFDFYE